MSVQLNESELRRLHDATNTAFRLYILLRWQGRRWSYGTLRQEFFRDTARSRFSHPPTKIELQKALQSLWRLGLVDLYRVKRQTIHVNCPFAVMDGVVESNLVSGLGGAWVEKTPDTPIVRPPIPKRIRNKVIDRDGPFCATCGTTRNLTIDHIRPVAHGGTDDLENLRVLCRSCNSRKHAKPNWGD